MPLCIDQLGSAPGRREQLVVTSPVWPQVSIARVYNYDISRRRALKQKAGGDAEAGEAAA